MRAAIYARVSSQRQARECTIASQLRDLPAYCDRQGWPVVEVYVDDGRSAKAGRLHARDGLARLLADAQAHRFDVIVVADLDRLTRSEDLAERGAILGSLQRAGVQIATAGGSLLDLDSTAGDLQAAIGTVFSAEWLRKHRARTVAGKLTAIGRGRKPAGPTPYGYRYDRATGAWSVDPEAGQVVREIVARVTASETCEAVAVDLHRRGVARPRGGRWSREAVWQIARREVYSTGRWVADKARGLAVAVPTIVTAEERAAALRALERHRRSGLRQTRHGYLLERLAVCGRCGAPLGIASAGRRVSRDGRPVTVPSRYVCCRRRRPVDGDRCGAPYHDTAAVDEALWSALADVLLAPDLVERAARRLRDGGGPDASADAARARAELERLEATERTLLERAGRIAPSALGAQLDRLHQARSEAAARLAAAERAAAGQHLAVAATAGLPELLGQLRAALADPTQVTAGTRRELVRSLVADVEVGDEALVARLHLPAERVGLGLGVGSSSVSRDHLGRLRVALAPPAAPPAVDLVAEGVLATWRARATAPSPAYLAPARVVGGVARNRDGRALELRSCAACPRTFWAMAAASARHCSHACYSAAGGRWKAVV